MADDEQHDTTPDGLRDDDAPLDAPAPEMAPEAPALEEELDPEATPGEAADVEDADVASEDEARADASESLALADAAPDAATAETGEPLAVEAPPPPPPAVESGSEPEPMAASGASDADAAAADGSRGPATPDIFSTRGGWRFGRVATVGLSALLTLLLLGTAGAAYATYDYSERYRGKILPGARIAGADVGGLNFKRAVRRVRAAIAPRLDREITVTWNGRKWRTTPRKLGARGNARRIVEAALAASDDTSFLDKMRMKLFDGTLGFSSDVAIRFPAQGARGFVEGIAAGLNREPVDAAIDASSGWVDITPAKTGHKVQVADSYKALMQALRSGDDKVALAVKTTEPEVTADDFDQILLVRIGENKLYLYDDGRITHEWVVATGEPNYMTPTGIYEVTEKRYMPTWVNPAPDGWGASMPASIPPGPGNPLGLRAINWSAPAIRFHGTSATYSLGYNASHGCVRMSNEDVIQLYDMIEVGTPIVSVVAGPLKPMYSSSTIGGEGG